MEMETGKMYDIRDGYVGDVVINVDEVDLLNVSTGEYEQIDAERLFEIHAMGIDWGKKGGDSYPVCIDNIALRLIGEPDEDVYYDIPPKVLNDYFKLFNRSNYHKLTLRELRKKAKNDTIDWLWAKRYVDEGNPLYMYPRFLTTLGPYHSENPKLIIHEVDMSYSHEINDYTGTVTAAEIVNGGVMFKKIRIPYEYLKTCWTLCTEGVTPIKAPKAFIDKYQNISPDERISKLTEYNTDPNSVPYRRVKASRPKTAEQIRVKKKSRRDLPEPTVDPAMYRFLITGRIKLIEELIDKALDERNQQMFRELCAERANLVEHHNRYAAANNWEVLQ